MMLTFGTIITFLSIRQFLVIFGNEDSPLTTGTHQILFDTSLPAKWSLIDEIHFSRL